jgi:DNA ligase 1
MFISPMLLQSTELPFDDNSYITELKLDGIKLILSKWNNKIKLYTRHNNEVTTLFPELTNIDIPDGTILDGEIVVSDNQGKPDFEAMMERFQSKNSQHEIQYCVFDIIYLNYEKVTNYPLIQRKTLLEDIIPEHPNIATVKWIYGNGIAYFDLVKQHDLEGIVLKRAHSKYQIDKRSYDWLKVINYQYADVNITGLRKDEFGVLLSFENGKSAGLMEFMPSNERKKLYRMYKFKSENDKFIFFDPIKCRVKYRNKTKEGKLRIPSFVEWIA